MPYKEFILNDTRSVRIYKRKNSRNLRLSIDSSGQVKVSIPKWAPYNAGLQFAKSRINWIESNLAETNLLKNLQLIGKAHHLNFIISDKPKITSKINENTITITYPSSLDFESEKVQLSAKKASTKALRLQAESLLPQRLEYLSIKHEVNYKSIKIKQLKRRWGSCDQNKNIVLNLYLIQLPWHLIDYVLLHELTHTIVLKHNQAFWDKLGEFIPKPKQLRNELNKYKPDIIGSK